MEEPIDYATAVEMIVFCPDWREKEEILKRVVRRLIEIEIIEQIEQNLKQEETDYE